MSATNIADVLELLEEYDYKNFKSLGKGSFGEVYLAKDCVAKKKVAIKICYQRLPGEWKYWYHFNHPNILELYDRFEIGQHFIYVMERAEHGTLKDWLARPFYKKICHRDHFNRWFWQLISTMEYLHSRGFYHLDIKMDNIFLDKHFDVKLGDLGFLCYFGQNLLLIGAPSFWPPEIQRMELMEQRVKAGPWLEKVDAFFVGASFLWLMAKLPDTKSMVFPSDMKETEDRIDYMYEQFDRHLKKVKNVPMRRLLKKLLHRDVERRLTCRTIFDFGHMEPTVKRTCCDCGLFGSGDSKLDLPSIDMDEAIQITTNIKKRSYSVFSRRDVREDVSWGPKE